MSILSGTAVKIFNFLGLTALGQTTKSGSLPVVLASDQVAVEVAFSLSANGDVTTDVGAYRWVSVQIVTLGGGGVTTTTFQCSNDGTTWVSQPLYISTSLTTGGGVTSAGGTGLYHGPVLGRYFRLHVTGMSGGTHAGVIEFNATPSFLQAHGVGASQQGTWNIGTLATVTNVVHVDDNAGTLSMDDGGGSITVDGSVVVSALTLPLPTGAATEGTVAATSTATGAQADAAWTTGNGSIIALLKAIASKIISTVAVTQSGTWTVQPGNTANTTAWKIDGSAVTQPISAASLPLPSGAATSANQPALGSAGTPSSDVITVQGIVSGTPQPVAGTFWQATQPVSVAATITVDTELGTADLDTGAGTDTRAVVGLLFGDSGGAKVVASNRPLPVDPSGVTSPVSAATLPLPTGAATAAKQPALGTAGTPSSDVISVQGVPGAAAIPVLGTFWQATQPVSVAAVVHVDDNSSTLSVDDGGGSITVDGTFWQATQPVSVAAVVHVDDNSGSVTVDGTVTDQAATSQQDFTFTCVNSAGTNASTTITGLGLYRSAAFYAVLQGNTGGTLDIYLQWSPDGGTTWVDYAHFAQIAAGAAAITRMFTITRYAQQTTLQTVGTGTSPALAAATIVGGAWGDRLRIVYFNSIGTTLGKLQTIKASFTT